MHNMRIAHYEYGNRNNHPEMRKRKLLLHKKEIVKIDAKVRREGLGLVPLKIYFKKSFVKMEIGLAKGKKQFDKRETIKSRQAERQIAQDHG